MKIVVAVAIAVTAAMMLLERPSLAADLPASVAPAPTHTRVVHRSSIRYRTYRTVYRTIGMPCVLRPHVIVRADWNGPQCRWVDNVIPFDPIGRRYRVVARRY